MVLHKWIYAFHLLNVVYLLFRSVCRKQELLQLDLEKAEESLMYKEQQRDALVGSSRLLTLHISHTWGRSTPRSKAKDNLFEYWITDKG